METPIEDKIIIKTVDCILVLPISEVLMFERNGRAWRLKDIIGNEYSLPCANTANSILSLSNSFLQINQSQIINSNYICKVENQTLNCELTIETSNSLTFSRRYYKTFVEKYLNKI